MADHTPRTPHRTPGAAHSTDRPMTGEPITDGPVTGGPAGAEPAAAITVEDVRAAHKMLSGVSRATAMEGSRYLSGLVGAPVHLKCENLQRTGSFKIRGAYVRIAGLSPQERAAGVVAASAGNHAQGVALAASLLGVRSTVFMPVGAPLPKVAATRDYGAEVRLHGQVVDETLAAAQDYARETGAVFIHPFDHRDIIAGQGTVGLEILEQCPEVRTIVVGIGGGGLAAGVALAVKALRPGREGRRGAGGGGGLLSAVARGRAPGGDRGAVDDGGRHQGRAARRCAVRDRRASWWTRSVRSPRTSCPARCCCAWSGRSWWWSRPGRARWRRCSSDPGSFEGPVVAVLSGGNVDPLLMQRILRHGMARRGPLPLAAAAADGPAGGAGDAARGAVRRSMPTCSTSAMCGRIRGSG